MTGYERIRERIAWKAHGIQEHAYLTNEEQGELRAYADALEMIHQEEKEISKHSQESFLVGILEGAGVALGIVAVLGIVWVMFGSALWAQW